MKNAIHATALATALHYPTTDRIVHWAGIASWVFLGAGLAGALIGLLG